MSPAGKELPWQHLPPFQLPGLAACRTALLLHGCQTRTRRLRQFTLCGGAAGCRGRAMLAGSGPWPELCPLAAVLASPARASLHALPACTHLGCVCGAAMAPTPCESPAGKVACRRILQSAPGSGFHLTVIRRYNPISNKGRASDTLEKQVPAVFQSNEGNKYRKDYIKWTNV